MFPSPGLKRISQAMKSEMTSDFDFTHGCDKQEVDVETRRHHAFRENAEKFSGMCCFQASCNSSVIATISDVT